MDIFKSIFTISDGLASFGFLICMAVSLVLGFVIAACNRYNNRYTRSLSFALVLLPVIVQAIIAMVNGQLGAGIAVAGAFGLVRFRSAPASARDITSIFLAVSVGIANGMGYVGIAVLLTLVVCIISLILSKVNFGAVRDNERDLKVVIPESLNYEDVLDPVIQSYTTRYELVRIKTTNMGSLYNLHYHITLKPDVSEKKFIDELRVYNGNLEISCARPDSKDDSTHI